jgi:hypothetical protein
MQEKKEVHDIGLDQENGTLSILSKFSDFRRGLLSELRQSTVCRDKGRRR